MADDQSKELLSALAGSSFEETVPVPIPVPVPVSVPFPVSVPVAIVLPTTLATNSGGAEGRGLAAVQVGPSEELAGEPDDGEPWFFDDCDLGFLVEVEETESQSPIKSENETESGPLSALDVQAIEADARSRSEEEEIHGILHLYKTSKMSKMRKEEKRSCILGILNIPGAVTRPNLRTFLEPFQEAIDEVKIIKDNMPSRYMALIRFNTQEVADNFYMVYSSCSFNQEDSEACQLVYVERVEVVNSRDGASFSMKGLVELPRCSLCLERTGESMRGIFTLLCDQSFQGHSQNATVVACTACSCCRGLEERNPRCLECGLRENLHICLICGLVLCERDVRGLADKHFDKTQHAYWMQLNNYKVWDYTESDCVQSAKSHKSSNMGQYGNEERVEAIQLKYSHLLSNQLEAQKIYLEEKMTQVESEPNEEINNMKAKLASTIERCAKLEYEMTELLKQKKAMETECTNLNIKLSKLITELREEQAINRCLRNNEILLQNKVKEKEQILKETCEQLELQITEIQEQLKEVIFYLETQQKLEELSPETTQEIQGEDTTIAVAPPENSTQEEEM